MTLLTILYPTAAAGAISLGIATDFQLGVTPRPEFIYVGTESNSNESAQNDQESLHKYRIAEATFSATGLSRTRTLIGVANGIVNVQGTLGWETFDDPIDPKLSTDSPYYWYVELNGKVYIGDGISEVVYNAKKGTLAKFEVEGAGEVPQKARLACAYRERLVLAAGSKWYMSRSGDAHNWEYFPAVQTQNDAVFDSTVERFAGDAIQALIPGQDDYLYFGCASSILLLRGDPLAGGQIDLVTDTVGMAFGNSWARDPNGVIYFFGSRGGVYRMAPGGLPSSISDATGGQDVTIQGDLESIDLNDYRMELEWDFEHDELVVTQIPYSVTDLTINRSWRWSKKLNAWWPDRVGSTGHIVFSSWSADGDLASERTLIFGGQDGYARKTSDTAKNDDSVAIDAFVTIGPIQSGGDSDVALNRIRAVLAREKGGCTFEVFSADTPDALDQYPYDKMIFSGTFEPGMNPRLPVRVRGAYLWIRLRNKKVNEGFAVESLAAELMARGTRRVMN